MPAAAQDQGVIRLGAKRPAADPDAPLSEARPATLSRQGFDYEAFQTRLESLWFQRKALLADGREADAAEQGELIRAFCREEGVRRLEHMAGALLAEADRYGEEGRYERALDSLALADAFDPGRAQIHFARAKNYWNMSGRSLAAAGELLRGVRASISGSLAGLALFKQLALVLVVSLAAGLFLFSFLMLVRHQVPLRHEIEEWVSRRADERLARPAGWAVLLLPLLTWIAAGWSALYWIAITFRFMRRAERLAAVGLLCGCVLALPAYRVSATVYRVTSDPVVRTTLAAAGGDYDPDRILKLRELVEAHPTDASYRFLLAGLYKNGRFFQEAFVEYQQALQIDPSLDQALINIGNIFHVTGQYPEAIAHYTRALEIDSTSILAYFNMHLAQSEAFRFRDAEESLKLARAIDSTRLTDLLVATREEQERAMVIDASLQVASVWSAALTGRGLLSSDEEVRAASGVRLGLQLVNPISIAAVVALLGCAFGAWSTRSHAAARRCIRCGRPFCHRCQSSRDVHEYCSQCLHLFVLGDGLAPETKTRKLFEVGQHEAWTRRTRRLLSWLLPGSAQLLRGRALAGTLLLLLWAGGLVAWNPRLLYPLERFADLGLRLELLGGVPVPRTYGVEPLAILGGICVVLVWVVGNAGFLRRREI